VRTLRRSNRRAAAGRHVRLPTSPTTRAATTPEKARPQCTTAATTVSIKWPGPLPSKRDPHTARAQGSKNPTLEGCDHRPVASKPAQRERAPQVHSIQEDYWSTTCGPVRPQAHGSCRCRKTGAPSCHPAAALLIRGSKPDPRRVRTDTPDRLSQGRRGHTPSSLSLSSPARGRPTSHVQELVRAASRGIPSRGSFRALCP
jgi:hypothetical protein